MIVKSRKKKIPMQYKVGIILILLGILYYSFSVKEVKRNDGVFVTEIPEQIILENPIKIEINPDYTVYEVAKYNVSARVLRIEDYNNDRASDLSKMDFALGWQQMSSNELLNTLEITQSNRFYFWRTEEANYPRHIIETQSANTHIIAANADVLQQLKNVKKNNIIRLEGYLINAESVKDDWRWRTSETRNDTGNGACEILYVEKVEILG